MWFQQQRNYKQANKTKKQHQNQPTNKNQSNFDLLSCAGVLRCAEQLTLSWNLDLLKSVAYLNQHDQANYFEPCNVIIAIN